MIINKAIITNLQKDIKNHCRNLEYLLVSNLFDIHQDEIIEELRKYQNPDGGFGHGLEPDTYLPDSSVVCTDMAVSTLNEVDDFSCKESMIKDIVKYYESVYIKEKECWELVPKEVDNYPHAIWWDYKYVETFSYGNPNPEIIGFLYENKKYLETIDIEYHINKVVNYIKNDFSNEARHNNILSCLMFYSYMPKKIQEEIYQYLQDAVTKELNSANWEEYSMQPYEVLLIAPIFLENNRELLEKNLEYCYNKLTEGLIQPTWQWYQYEEYFEKIKNHWSGRITYNMIKAILNS